MKPSSSKSALNVTDTKERFINAAIPVFAERGFYGASIATIASALPFSKQALLHHFGSKERLYGEVLARISGSLMTALKAATENDHGNADPIKTAFISIFDYSMADADSTTLLMRELLDNRSRAASAQIWHLKPFLDTLTRIVRDHADGPVPQSNALCFTYQILGAINYFAVSGPTLCGIYGDQGYRKMAREYPDHLQRLIDAGLKEMCASESSTQKKP